MPWPFDSHVSIADAIKWLHCTCCAVELRKKIQSAVTLSNSSNENVAFKIRTTAPRQYCVRPSQGVVMPGKRTKISIVMQPMDSWPAESASRDKFMVQSCTTTLTDPADFPTDMFADEKDLKKVKLKVFQDFEWRYDHCCISIALVLNVTSLGFRKIDFKGGVFIFSLSLFQLFPIFEPTRKRHH